jgi:small subunit ribosomal protein S3
MGQKVHPTGIRLGILGIKDGQGHRSVWYADDRNYAKMLHGDIKVRAFLRKSLEKSFVGRIQIERLSGSAKIIIYSARPGTIIGKKGEGIEFLRKSASSILDVPVHMTIEEIKRPELDSHLVADGIAQQLVRRVMFRRAMKRAVSSALRLGAKGIKICVSGRLGGTEIARTEWCREGRVPLHTYRANIDYSTAEAHTTYGIIGVKVWIFKGEVLPQARTAEAMG